MDELKASCSATWAHGPHQWLGWFTANGVRKEMTYNCSGIGGSKSEAEAAVLSTFTGEQLEYLSDQILASVKSAHQERIMKSLTAAQQVLINDLTSRAWVAAMGKTDV